MLTAVSFFLWLAPLSAALPPLEDVFGPTNLYGISGNGALTAGFSHQGEVTLLRFPSPSFYDQLFYRTKPHFRFQPRMGAHKWAGLLWGEVGPSLLHFFRDETATSAYQSMWGSHYQTRFSSGALFEAFVSPNDDLLFLRLHAKGSRQIFFSENLSLSARKKKELPILDWLHDEENDFGLLGPDAQGILYRFLPYGSKKRWALRLKKAYAEGGMDAVREALRGARGIFVAMTTEPSASIFTGRFLPEKDFSEAYAAYRRGEKPKAQFLLGQLTSFFVFPKKTQEATVLLSFAESWEKARAQALRGRGGFSRFSAQEKSYWKEKLAKAQIPENLPSRYRPFLLRTLQTIFIAMDKKSKAVVASVSTQPPYNLDWPRDGSFINLLLDWAGYTDIVTAHNLFYLKVQRKVASPGKPKGSFAMNFYADGEVGGPIAFEVDETGLALWTLVEHARYLPAQKRRAYLKRVYPGIQAAAEALVECRDPASLLLCPAQEDDNLERTQGPQGAITAYTGLRNATMAAAFLGHREDAKKFATRAKELRTAIEKAFFDSRRRIYPVGRGLAGWFIYPSFFLQGALRSQEASYILRETRRALFDQSVLGSMYDAKGVLSLSLFAREKVQPLLDELALKIPMAGTGHVGEVYLRGEHFGRSGWVNIQAPPHVWEATLITLSLYARYASTPFLEKVAAPNFL